MGLRSYLAVSEITHQKNPDFLSYNTALFINKKQCETTNELRIVNKGTLLPVFNNPEWWLTRIVYVNRS